MALVDLVPTPSPVTEDFMRQRILQSYSEVLLVDLGKNAPVKKRISALQK